MGGRGTTYAFGLAWFFLSLSLSVSLNLSPAFRVWLIACASWHRVPRQAVRFADSARATLDEERAESKDTSKPVHFTPQSSLRRAVKEQELGFFLACVDVSMKHAKVSWRRRGEGAREGCKEA